MGVDGGFADGVQAFRAQIHGAKVVQNERVGHQQKRDDGRKPRRRVDDYRKRRYQHQGTPDHEVKKLD